MEIKHYDKSTVHLLEKGIAKFPYLELFAYREVKLEERAKWTVALLKKNFVDEGGVVIGLKEGDDLVGIAGARKLSFDTEHFGVPMGRVGPFHLAKEMTSREGKELVDACLVHLIGLGCRFVDCRVPTADLMAARSLERSGFYLGDTQVDYAFRVQAAMLPSMRHRVQLRNVEPADEKALLDLTRETFTGYIDRFHKDPFFDNEKATEMYVKWLENSLGGLADHITVAQAGKRIGGFLTFQIKHEQNKIVKTRFAEGVLAGVAPWTRGKGVYTSILADAMYWFANNCDIGTVVTQVDNTAVQAAWSRLGYRLVQGRYTFHWHE
ncbi:MAG: hypothetical protein ACTSXZ_03540 [Alphaproteobacteria bacterium]